ncbi:MAG TPA: AAA-like domain-containing protein, partial [Polyangia bacterium]|nr:AAA-like domain-containing protein [Polyangia bacterium]
MSTAEMTAQPVLQVGGTLRRDALYVERAADRELPERLGRGEYCYLLAARQIGKSSLCVRTARALRRDGARTAFVDLTQAGSGAANPDQWYASIAQRIAEELDLPNPTTYWEAHNLLPPVHRFAEYLRHEGLARVPEPVVVFIDEVDATRGLPAQARDEFFIGLRALYNARAQDPTFERLTFCLIGWGLPSDLVQDTALTPFNIGHAIQLEDFSREEMNAFAPALAGMPGPPQALLDEIYAWTEGHPYMTQKLVEALIEGERVTVTGGDGAVLVAGEVRRLFLERGRVEDANLSFAARCFDRRDDRVPATRVPTLLQLYRRLLEGQPVPAQGNDEVQASLRLTGVAAERRDADGAWLRVRNRVFARVFDAAWVKEREAERRLTEPLRQWLLSGKQDIALQGEALREAETWAQGRQDLTAEEQEFLRAGLEAERQTAELRQRQAEAEARRRRRTNVALLVVAVVLGSSLLVAFGQYRQARQAEQRALAAQERAETGLLNEQAERAMALAEQPAHRLRALALAMQSLQSSLVPHRSPSLAVKNGLLVTALQSIPTTLAGHTGAIWRSVFSPDGSRILTASLDGTARVWDAGTGRSLLTLRGHTNWVVAAAFSPDGSRILTASYDGTARVWDAGTGRSLLTLQGHTNWVVAAAFSLDGSRILTASYDGTVRVWDAGTGRSLLTLQGHTKEVVAATFSSDGSRILTASSDKTARVWDAGTGRSLLTLQGHTKAVVAAAFSPNGSRILSASYDGTARVWD